MIYVILILIIVIVLAIHGFIYSREAERNNPPIGRFVFVNEVKIHYLDLNPAAAGRPLVLIHGASTNILDMQVALGALAERRRVILVDRPGFGYSDRSETGTTLSSQATCIEGVLQQLGVTAPIVIGQSFGTAVALAYALKYPVNLAGLLLLAPVSHRWPGGVALYNHLVLSPVVGPFLLYCLIPLFGRFAGRQAVSAAFWPCTAPEGYFDQSGMSLLFRPATFRSNAEDLVSLYDQVTEMEDHYHEIKVPLRMLAGTHDTVVLSTIHAFSLEQKVADASLKYLPQIGHPLHHGAFAEIEQELKLLEVEIERRAS